MCRNIVGQATCGTVENKTNTLPGHSQYCVLTVHFSRTTLRLKGSGLIYPRSSWWTYPEAGKHSKEQADGRTHTAISRAPDIGDRFIIAAVAASSEVTAFQDQLGFSSFISHISTSRAMLPNTALQLDIRFLLRNEHYHAALDIVHDVESVALERVFFRNIMQGDKQHPRPHCVGPLFSLSEEWEKRYWQTGRPPDLRHKAHRNNGAACFALPSFSLAFFLDSIALAFQTIDTIGVASLSTNLSTYPPCQETPVQKP